MTTHTPAPPRERREPGEVFGSGFSLFADMLLVGLLTSLACLPVLTLPAAFSAASATLGASARTGAPVTTATYVRHLRAHLSARSLAGGLLPPLLVLVLLTDMALLDSALPGAPVMAPALVLLALGMTTVALRSTALDGAHRLSLREALVRSAAEPRSTVLLAGAVLLAAVLAWSMPLLVPLLPGPLAFAATVVDLRSPARTEER
ncbi:hypothetical protein OKJ48_09460 [Streptomyces kunmingensis]|uniref:Integral membrane protein n=1 Tax=Streptomyces kunmingensis TaxID=68225 RepID=A0ABU6C6Y3_9ACTN|nr:hypothetical protein [Streptomyces kunmingensis]MEB3960472.1 hypothetical protein [Streptomyces kunmingensis]